MSDTIRPYVSAECGAGHECSTRGSSLYACMKKSRGAQYTANIVERSERRTKEKLYATNVPLAVLQTVRRSVKALCVR